MDLGMFIHKKWNNKYYPTKPFFIQFIKNGFVFISILFIQVLLSSQNLNYKNFNVQNGLTSNEVFDIYQDPNKNIWIATSRGVVKYDGEEFIPYTKKDGLGDNTIFYIQPDKKGRIWFLSNNGILSYFYEGQMHLYPFNNVLQKIPGGSGIPRSIYVEDDGTVYISFIRSGVFKINNEGHLTSLITIGKKQRKVYGVYCYQQTPLLFIKSSSEDSNLNDYLYIKCSSAKSYITHEGRARINIFFLKRRNGDLLISISKTLYHFHNNELIKEYIYQMDIISLYEDKDSNVWIGCLAMGVKKFEANSSFEENGSVEKYFNNLSISKTMQDEDESYWFTSLESGIFYVPNMHIKTLVNVTSLQPGFYISMIKTIRNQLYIGTNNSDIYTYNGKLMKKSIDLSGKIGTPYNIYDLKAGLYLTGGTKSGFFKNGIFNPKPGLTSNILIIDNNSNAYVARHKKFIKVSSQGDTLVIKNKKKIRFEALYYDSQHRIWCGGEDGLYYLKNDQLQKLEVPVLSSSRIVGIEEYEGRLYLATLGNGIGILSKSSLHFINTSSGLPSDMVNSILLQKKQGWLWAATSTGLCKINLKSQTVEMVVNEKKGLPPSEPRMLAILNDTLFVAGNNYLSFFNTLTIQANQQDPKIIIKKIKVNDTLLNSNHSHIFNYDENNIEFQLNGYIYSQLGEVHYKYRLKGLTDKYSYTTNNIVRFMFLPPGDYTFEAFALNEDGKVSSVPAIYVFTIQKAYWKTNWFYMVVVTALIVSIIAIIYIFLKRINAKRNVSLQLLEYKQQAFTNQMNPHFIFNALNSIQTYILAENKNEAINYLGRFSKLMRLTLHNSRSSQVSIQAETDLLTHYLELEKTRHAGVKYRIYVDGEINAEMILIPSMLIQPFIENSLKHGILKKKGQNGTIEISFYKKEGLLYCNIVDDGIGINQAKTEMTGHHEYISAGIEITLARLKLLCQTYQTPYYFQIQDKSDLYPNDRGTIVIFIIPYKTVQ